MIFYVLRIALTGLILVLEFILMRKLLKISGKKLLIIMTLSFYIVSAILCQIPFEEKILKFNKVEHAFRYRFFNKRIERIIEKDDYCFVIYKNNNNSFSYTYFLKENGKWRLDNLNYPSVEFEFKMLCSLTIVRIPETENVLLIVRYTNETKEKIEVTDVLGSKFENITQENMPEFKRYYTVIENNLDDYYLIINGESIYVDLNI